ncbi:MAG TPA: hypothetical protein VNJ07_04220 [Chitinophagales bacterium]|nr:hypothetical protein [Chitinophagales bacterium]
MGKAAVSMVVFGLYLSIMGIILLIEPNFLLGLFGIPETDEVWIRVIGMLVLILAVYYIQTARMDLTEFFWLSVYVRMFVIVFFTAFVMMGLVKPALILFGAVDMMGAAWTWWALKAEGK